MRITETEIVNETRKIEVGFVCDRCGDKVLYDSHRTDNFRINYEAGYGTTNDGTRICADVCDNCIVEIFKKEIPKSITRYF